LLTEELGGKNDTVRNGQFFDVVCSQQVLDLLKEIQAKEIDNGKGEQFLEPLRAIYDRLRKDPENFGARLYRLPALRVVVYTAVVPPLGVQYAVHEEKPLVFIRWFQRSE
jgi:hypothetical protein